MACICLRELPGKAGPKFPICANILDRAGYSGGSRKGETLKRWLKGWKVKVWNEEDVKRPCRSSGERIRAVRIQQKQSSGCCKDDLPSHAKVFASLAPFLVVMILVPGILAFQWPRGEGMTSLGFPLKQSQLRAEARNQKGIFFWQFLQSCACAHYSHLWRVSGALSITLHEFTPKSLT